ncbi:MAG: transposase [Betaproteobacteria bacterium]|nr:transposase [Betaproteobacteria bacterium]
MTRPLRIEYPGAVYHVTSRGNARQRVFLDGDDREAFLATLAWVVERFGWLCHAYCLMDNHFHLLIETPEANLSRGMRQLNGVYTQTFNRRHQRAGHLFRGRFKGILVEKDSYLLELSRYIVLNPVRAKVVKHPGRYAWSSYRATLGVAPVPPALTIDRLLERFAKTRSVAQKRYAEFVQAGIGGASPWEKLKGQVLLGDVAFIEKMAPQLNQRLASMETSRRRRLMHRPSLKTLLAGTKSKEARNSMLARAYLEHGYTLAELGRATDLHFATVSRIIKAVEKKSQSKM